MGLAAHIPRRLAWTAAICAVLAGLSLGAGIAIGRARQASGSLETGPFWADVIMLTLAGAGLAIAAFGFGLAAAIRCLIGWYDARPRQSGK